MHIANYNVRTLLSEENLLEMEEELSHIKCDVESLSEGKEKNM